MCNVRDIRRNTYRSQLTFPKQVIRIIANIFYREHGNVIVVVPVVLREITQGSQ